MKTLLFCFVAMALCSSAVLGSINVPSDGSDGAFSPTANVEVDLSQAVTGTWNQAGTGTGVYDADKWAVVFKYSSVNIPAGVTVTFKNHPSGGPVVWLVQGDVVVAGTVTVGVAEPPGGYAGPGGFRSLTVPSSGGNGIGLGPGGADGGYSYGHYRYAYGNERVMPLIGGSGGSVVSGAGAILVAASGAIRLQGSGLIDASVNSPYLFCGSGGGIRLVSDTLEKDAEAGLLARWLYSDEVAGRIRVETNHMVPDIVPGNPPASMALAGTTAQIWPETTDPRIKSVSLGGVGVPSDPRPGLTTPMHVDVYFEGAATRTLIIQAENVPLDWHVRARMAPKSGGSAQYIAATRTGGDLANSTWEAQIPLAAGFSAIQVRASVD